MTELKTRLNDEARRPSEERGVTLIEVLLVLGIATAFIAGGLGLYTQAQNANEARNAVTDVYGVIATVRTAYGAANSYDGLTLARAGFTAALMNLPTAWDIDITLEEAIADPMAAPPLPPRAFAVVVGGLDEAQCNVLQNNFAPQFHVTTGVVAQTAAQLQALNGNDMDALGCTTAVTTNIVTIVAN